MGGEIIVLLLKKWESKVPLYCLWQQRNLDDIRSMKWIRRILKALGEGVEGKVWWFVGSFTYIIEHKATSKCLDEKKV